jgi:hypothetical protein
LCQIPIEKSKNLAVKNTQLKAQINDTWWEGTKALTRLVVENFSRGNYKDLSGNTFKEITESEINKIGDESFCVEYQFLIRVSNDTEGGEKAIKTLGGFKNEVIDEYKKLTGREDFEEYFKDRGSLYSKMDAIATERGDGGVLFEYSKVISDIVVGRRGSKVFMQIYEDTLKFYGKWNVMIEEIIKRNT